MNDFECKLCKNNFRDKFNLNRHYNKKNACISTQQVLKYLDEIERLKKGNSSIEINGDNNMINSHNNINITIVVNRFGDENGEHINIPNILNQSIDALFIELVNQIYCDPGHPENHTALVTDIKSKYARVFNGKEFEYKMFTQCFEKIESKIYEIIEVKVNNFIKKNSDKKTQIELLREMLDNVKKEISESQLYYNQLLSKTKCELYNARDTIKNTHC